MFPSDATVGVTWLISRNRPRAADLKRTIAMTIEILHLTAQIQRWINARVARHLAAQAARLSR